MAIVCAVVLVGLAAWPSQSRAEETKATVCKIGIYIVSINKIQTSDSTFDADFWMWSLCPDKDLDPLKTLQFINAQSVTGELETTDPRGDVWWKTRFFSGTFRQNFDLTNYPFDDQFLELKIEESALDDSDLLYAVDTAASGMDKTQNPAGWVVSDLKMTSGVTVRDTTFGDPELLGGKSGYASAVVKLKADRTDGANFVKATFPLFIAAFLALLCMGFDVTATDQLLGRMGALGSMLFVVVFSFVSIDQLVGAHQKLYFLDMVHFAALGIILVETGWSLFAHRASNGGKDPAVVQRWDRRMAIGMAAVYLTVNVVMVMIASRH